ncbi:hypothetical protein JMJ77_0000774 [Colletotrichum scovillei]|uniref:Uncharacterized protein n=1 Tax=Colletotrichum scovillei TaxID=1209932 RepID=A0A9P7RDK5_9PEZI|nr:hypothetical protein JMJ77_0000774 [Colletotrichum scovillei]KAG7071983.1 hypothetical protein JMJ76_0004848 [Colletotrichum scovillei]KAG7080261.1 hypothetical protein JMJ78_0007359 [Colletotrichum scovillei]
MQITFSLAYLLLAAAASCQHDGGNREADTPGVTATQPSSIATFNFSPSHVGQNSQDIANTFSLVIPAQVPTTLATSTESAPSGALLLAPPKGRRPANGLPWYLERDIKDLNTVWCVSRGHYDVSYKPFHVWALAGQIHPRHKHKFTFPTLMKEEEPGGEYEIIPRTYRVTANNYLPDVVDVKDLLCMYIRARNFGEVRPDIETGTNAMLAKIDDHTLLKIMPYPTVIKVEPLFNIHGEPHPNDWKNQQDDRPLRPVKQRPFPVPTLLP